MPRFLFFSLLLTAACSTPKKPAAPAPPPQPPKITHFYSNTNPVPPGESATVCYGTAEATEVTLSPYSDTLKPSMNRCIALTPTRPTTYTLTAKGPGGQTTSTLTLAIGGAPTPSAPASPATPLITSFQSIGGGVVPPGKPVQFCYSTRPETVAVSLTPPAAGALKPGQNQCFTATVTKTTSYILTARDAAGSTDRMQVTVTIAQ
ncbi:MAG: hypothetical protein INH43_26370 [Acidobacteriaceae bacterium]|nr:hypothetical protein [Acidobacteriaceae bacterium]